MGKSLVIKGANFQVNGIQDLSTYTDISTNILESGVHRQYIHYLNDNRNNQFQYLSNALATTKICTIDVSAYVGRTIKLYASDSGASSSYTGGAWFKCFASAVSVTLPWTGTTSIQNAVTVVEHIDYAGNGYGNPGWWTLTVPQNAVYLVFTNNSSFVTTPKVYVSNE